MIDLQSVHGRVSLSVGRWGNDFFRALSQIVRKVLGRGHVPLLELALLHAMTNQKMVWHAPLVELDVFGIVIILLLVQQVLLRPLGNIVVVERVSLVELGLVLTDSGPVSFLFKN